MEKMQSGEVQLGELVDILKEKIKYTTVPLSKVTLSEDLGKLKVPGEAALEIDDVALMALCKYTGVNFLYVARCPASLAKQNLEYWLSENPESETTLQIFDGALELLFPADSERLRVEAVLESIGGDGRVVDFNRSEKKTKVDVLVDEVEGWEYGYRLTISPTRTSYVELLAVKDGALFAAPAFGGKITQRRKTVEEILTEFRESVEQIKAESLAFSLTLSDMKKEPIPCIPAKVVDSLLEGSSVAKSARRGIAEEVNAGLPTSPSYYDLLVQFAEAGGSLTKSRTAMEELAGKVFAGLRPDLCAECKEPV